MNIWYDYGYILDDGTLNGIGGCATKKAAIQAAKDLEKETGEKCGIEKRTAKPKRYIYDYGYNAF